MSGEEVAFKNMSRRSSVILCYEVANHVLAHLTHFYVATNFSKKENNIISYLSGYVVFTFLQTYKKLKIVPGQAGISKCKHLTSRKVNTSRRVGK